MPLGANKVALYGASADTGTAVLLSTATASNDASIEFTLPTAYKQVKFGFYNITPATDHTSLQFQVNASGQTGYNETITSTFFQAYHAEDDSATSLAYGTTHDQAQGTGYQTIADTIGNASDECTVGELSLFNPASTTYVKHFYGRTNQYDSAPYTVDSYPAGYINLTSALSEISFKMSSGNISSGTIKMWGIK